MSIRNVSALVLGILVPSIAQAQQSFEAVFSGYLRPCITITAPDYAAVQWFNPDRTDISVTGPFAVASADGRRVFGVSDPLPGIAFQVSEIFPNGGQTPFFTLAGYEAGSITQAADGRLFVAARLGVGPAWFLVVISAAGAQEAIHPIPTPGEVGIIAVGSDGCTIFYTQEGVIQRMNGCTGAALTPFAAVAASDVYPLPNGQVLVGRDDQVVVYSAAGAVLRTIGLGSYGFAPGSEVIQVALGPDQQTLWIAAIPGCDLEGEVPGQLLRVSFATGAELAREPLAEVRLGTGLVIGLNAVAVPLAGTTVLLFFALTLAGAAVFVLGKQP